MWWGESKHPRDTDGKFRKVGLMEGMGENDIDESEENIVFRKGNLVYTRKPDNLKIVITKYNYQKPKALEVKKFRDVFDMVDYLDLHGEYYD